MPWVNYLHFNSKNPPTLIEVIKNSIPPNPIQPTKTKTMTTLLTTTPIIMAIMATTAIQVKPN